MQFFVLLRKMKSKKNSDELDLDLEIDDVFEQTLKAKEDPKPKKKKTAMEEYLENFPVKTLSEDEKIEGTVLYVDKNALYVDLGEFGTGIVYGREIKDGIGKNKKKIKLGDKIKASILEVENDEGYVELSVKEAIREEAWKDLQEKMKTRETITLKVIEVNKGGMMMELNGVIGFMPVSQLTPEHYPRVEDGDKNKIFEILKSYLGVEMKVCVIDINQDEEKLIFSEKEAYKDSEKEAISEFKRGDVIEGEVSGVVDFGAFIKFLPPSKKDSKEDKDMLEGLVHISQLDWKLIENPRDIVKVGEKVKAKIIGIDDTRISLSMRDLKKDPWMAAGEQYKVGDVVSGTVRKINHFGAFVYLNDDIHGLAHISEFIANHRGKNIDEIIKAGEKYNWEIMSLDPREHRMGLKLSTKKAEKKAEKEEKKEAEIVAEEKKEKKSEKKKDENKKEKTESKKTEKKSDKKEVKKEVKEKVKKKVKKEEAK